MRIYPLIVLSLLRLTAANPPVISNVQIDDISHSGARVTWLTDSASTTKLQWGLTTSYAYTRDIYWQNYTTHGYFVSGLQPSTLYNVRVCSKDSVEICSANVTFTTLAEPAAHPALPQLPAEVDVTAPAVTGSTLNVAADCSNLQAQLNAAAALDGNLTHEVVLPAGTLCVGRYQLPARSGANPSGAGWIYVRSTAALPPDGTRVTPAMAANFARITGNFVSAYYYTGPPGSCDLGDLWWDSDDVTPKLYKCTSNVGPVWTIITPAATGTTVPATCAEGDWFFKTDEPDRHKQAWWCTETNAYRNVYLDNGGAVTDWAAIYPHANAKRWRFAGITLQPLKTPTSYIAQFNQGIGDQKGSVNFCLAYTVKTNDRIVFDRVLFDGRGYPNRTHTAFCTADGSNIGIVNSYFNEINRWRPSISYETTANAIFFLNGPGPVRIENNQFHNCHGITIFHSDDTGSPTPTSANDVVIRRNLFYESPSNNGFDPTSVGRYYYRRHMVEMKFGERWLVEGNTFDGGWPAVNQGATIALTPRPGWVNLQLNPLALRDVWVRNNTFKNAPQGFLLTGRNDYTNFQPKGAQRIAITNNLTYRTGIASTGQVTGWPYGNVFNGQFINMGLGIEDLTIWNNTVHGSYTACCNLAFLGHGWDDANEGLHAANNIATMDAAMSIYVPGGVWLGGGFQGTAALNLTWKKESAPGWVFTNNLLHRPSGFNSDYPANNFWITNLSAVAYRDSANFDYSLASSSPYRAGGAQAGFDGGDLGVNMYALRAASGDVRGVSVISTGSTHAVFRYTTYNSQSCAADLSTSADMSAAVRFTDAGGGRGRLLTASGLAADTLYYWRLYCGTTVSGSFRTKVASGAVLNAAITARPPVGMSVDHAVAEYGPTPSFGAATAPAACATGCSLTISGNAGAALYYRILYRKADNTVIATSPAHTVIP